MRNYSLDGRSVELKVVRLGKDTHVAFTRDRRGRVSAVLLADSGSISVGLSKKVWAAFVKDGGIPVGATVVQAASVFRRWAARTGV